MNIHNVHLILALTAFILVDVCYCSTNKAKDASRVTDRLLNREENNSHDPTLFHKVTKLHLLLLFCLVEEITVHFL